jgi:serine/threonine-protein kinase RsbW
VSFPDEPEGAMRHELRMTVGAQGSGVVEVKATFARFAEAHALSPPVRRSMSVALDELVANALSHGLAALVEVAVELDQKRLSITISDDGPSFDPFARDAPDTTLSLEARPIGGLGIHLVQRLVDEVSYERRNGCNVVILQKYLAGGGQTDFPEGV